MPRSFDRRKFLKQLGGGLIVVFCLGDLSLLKGWSQSGEQKELNFNAYLRIKEDGRVGVLRQAVPEWLNSDPLRMLALVMGGRAHFTYC